jgi:hypothetical protein
MMNSNSEWDYTMKLLVMWLAISPFAFGLLGCFVLYNQSSISRDIQELNNNMRMLQLTQQTSTTERGSLGCIQQEEGFGWFHRTTRSNCDGQ